MIYIEEGNWFDEYSAEDIPEAPGLYCYWLAPYRLVNLGLTQDKIKQRMVNPDEIRKILIKKIYNVSKFLSVEEISGSLSNNKNGSSLRYEYILRGYKKRNDDLKVVISNLDDEEIYEYIWLVQSISFFAIPIYVGITVEQTLLQRYSQHKADYLLDTIEKNSFGRRLRESSLKWRDLIFSCHCTDGIPNQKLFRILEKHLHSVMQPAMSLN